MIQSDGKSFCALEMSDSAWGCHYGMKNMWLLYDLSSIYRQLSLYYTAQVIGAYF